MFASLHVALHADFKDYAGAEACFADVDACLFCLGKSGAMLQARRDGVRARIIENREIRAMADRAKRSVGRGIN